MHLRATKAGAIGEKRLLAGHDQKASIDLPAASKPTATAVAPPPQVLCEVMSPEGLKEWKPCKPH